MCGAFEQLSPRQRQIAELVASGLENKEIATEIEPRMSENTVKAHLRRIFEKLAIHNRSELTAIWVRCQALREAAGEAQTPGSGVA